MLNEIFQKSSFFFFFLILFSFVLYRDAAFGDRQRMESGSCPVVDKRDTCVQCHQLSEQEAIAIITGGEKEGFDFKVLNISLAPIRGFWEVFIQSKRGKGIVYVNFSKNYVLSGHIIDPKSRVNLTRERFQSLNKIDVSRIPTESALLLGKEGAKHKVIVFDDPDCPYCKKLHPELKKVIKEEPDIAFYIKLYPLPMHKEAYKKSLTIVCKQSVELLEDSFAGKKIPEKKCDSKEIDNNIKLAKELGINGVPTMVMPDGTLLSGQIKAEKIIKKVLKDNR